MYKYFCFIFIIIYLLTSCTKNSNENKEKNSVTNRTVNLAIWSQYIDDSEIKEFEAKTQIKINITNYSSNEELLAKLQAGATGFDVAVPSDYMVFIMSKQNLLNELDKTKISNISGLDPKLLDKNFDKGNKFSFPYGWGTTGIAVNKNLYKEPIKNWKDVFNNPKLKNKFSLLDDVRETLGAALKSLGYSLNTKNINELKKAKELLIDAKKRVKAFSSETVDLLTSEEVVVAHAYSSDALQASKKTNGKIDFIIPEDGTSYWMDNLVIPKGALHINEAHELINFMIDKKTNIAHVLKIMTAPVVKDISLLPPELQKDQRLMPAPEKLKKSEMMIDLGEANELWDKIWTEIKAQN